MIRCKLLALIPTLAALFLAGCMKPDPYPHGWVLFNVAPEAPPSGWRPVEDAGSGVSMSVPPAWEVWDRNNQAQVDAFAAKVAQIKGPAAAANLGFFEYGLVPDLLLVDTSSEGLKPPSYTYVAVIYSKAGKSSDLDKIERGMRAKESDPVERVMLPIGPCLRQTHEQTEQTSETKTTPVRTTSYMFMQGPNLYVVRFTSPVERYQDVQSLMEKAMHTLRLTAPNESVLAARKDQKPTSQAIRSFRPGDPGYVNQQLPDQSWQQQQQQQLYPSQPQNTAPDQSSAPIPPPSATGGSSDPGNPSQGSPGTTPPGQDPGTGPTTGASGQTGATGSG